MFIDTGIVLKCPKCGREGKLYIHVRTRVKRNKQYVEKIFYIVHSNIFDRCSISQESLVKLGIDPMKLIETFHTWGKT